jgi:hypothetical protein
VLSLEVDKRTALVADRTPDLAKLRASTADPPRLERAHGHAEKFGCEVFIECGIGIGRNGCYLHGAASLLATMRSLSDRALTPKGHPGHVRDVLDVRDVSCGRSGPLRPGTFGRRQ